MTKRFYVTMTWDDFPEGGSFGTVVEAENEAAAEEMCRDEMVEARYDPDWDEKWEESREDIRKLWSADWHRIDCFDLDEFIERHNSKRTDELLDLARGIAAQEPMWFDDNPQLQALLNGWIEKARELTKDTPKS